MIDAAAVVHLPDLLRRFRTDHPDVDLRLRVAPSAELLDLLVAGELDLVVCVDPPTPVSGIDTAPLLTEDLAVYGPPGNPNGPPATWGPWVLFPAGSHTRALVVDELRRLGAPIDVIAESHQPDVLREMVQLGVGWTVLPTSQAESGDRPLHRRRKLTSRRLVLATRCRVRPRPGRRRTRCDARGAKLTNPRSGVQSGRPADADVDTGRPHRQWRSGWARKTGRGDQVIIEVQQVGSMQFPRRMIDGCVAQPAGSGGRDETPSRGEKASEWLGGSDRPTRPNGDLRRGCHARAWPGAPDPAGDDVTCPHVDGRSRVVRQRIRHAGHAGGEEAVDVQREEPHADTASGSNVGAHVDLGERPDDRERCHAGDAETIHVERDQPDPGAAVERVDLDAVGKQPLDDVGLEAPVQEHDVVPPLDHHRSPDRFRAGERLQIVGDDASGSAHRRLVTLSTMSRTMALSGKFPLLRRNASADLTAGELP